MTTYETFHFASASTWNIVLRVIRVDCFDFAFFSTEHFSALNKKANEICELQKLIVHLDCGNLLHKQKRINLHKCNRVTLFQWKATKYHYFLGIRGRSTVEKVILFFAKVHRVSWWMNQKIGTCLGKHLSNYLSCCLWCNCPSRSKGDLSASKVYILFSCYWSISNDPFVRAHFDLNN